MACLSDPPLIEPLEARIAPASLTFTDLDGDEVTITTSKGTDAQLAAAVTFAGNVLQLLDLSSNSIFKGTDLKIEVTSGGGDGLVNVGYINAAGLDLGNVLIDGDLGQIDAGDAKLSTPAIKSLEIASLAALGVTTQAAGGSIVSDIFGSITTVKVNGNVHGTLLINGGKSAGIGTLTVTGILVGGDQVASGSIDATGNIATATVGGITGGSAAESGRLVARSFGTLTIDGNLLGGTGEKSGTVRANQSINEVKVTGDIIGGADANAHNSGEIRAARSILLATVDGEIRGGEGKNSGSVGAGASLRVVTVGGGLFGGGGFESGTLGSVGQVESVTITGGITGGIGDKSGGILATARLDEITINGNVTGGLGKQSGVIATDGTIANVTINGSLIGGNGEESGAIGSEKKIATVLITGDIQGGGGLASGGILSSGTIGSVTIQGVVAGGSGEDSGAIGAVGAIQSVNIQGDLEGGGGDRSGVVLSGTYLASVQIGGTIVGGYGGESGSVRSDGNIGFVSAGGIDGGFSFSSGQIFALKNIQEAVIDGDVRSGNTFQAGSIVAIKTISSVTVRGDLQGGGFEGASGYQGGSIVANRLNNVLIEGSVYGGSNFQSGVILALSSFSSEEGSEGGSSKPNGFIDKIVIRGNVIGGSGSLSGSISSEGKINSVTIGSTQVPRAESFGSLFGGPGFQSGRIDARGNINSIKIFGEISGGAIDSGGNVKTIEIGGNLDGGYGLSANGGEFESIAGPRGIDVSGEGNGRISITGHLGKIVIGGSIFGSFSANSGQVLAGSIGSVEVGFDVVAGFGDRSGSIVSLRDIGSVEIGGSVTSYTRFEGVGGFAAGSISAERNLGVVTIGSVAGNPEAKVYITAGGTLGAKTDKQALAIKSLTIRDYIDRGQILAGYKIIDSGNPELGMELTPVNPDVQIGKVVVGTPSSESSSVWNSSDIVAGAESVEGRAFGNADDRLIGGSAGTKVIAKIASVIINGRVFGEGGQGSFNTNGIVAEHVVSVKIMDDNVNLKNGPRNDFSIPVTDDPMGGLFVNEVTKDPRNLGE